MGVAAPGGARGRAATTAAGVAIPCQAIGLQPRQEIIDLHQLVQNYLQNCHSIHPDREFRYQGIERGIKAEVSDFRIEQLLDKLVDNAVEAVLMWTTKDGWPVVGNKGEPSYSARTRTLIRDCSRS